MFQAKGVGVLGIAGAAAFALVKAIPSLFGKRLTPDEEMLKIMRDGKNVERVPLLVEQGASLALLISDPKFSELGPERAKETATNDPLAIMEGATLAHIAACNGHEAALEELFHAGALLEKKDAFGRTPAHYAAAGGKCNCLVFLFNNGSKISAKDSFKRHCLHYAALSIVNGEAAYRASGDTTALARVVDAMAILYLFSILVPPMPLKKLAAAKDAHGLSVAQAVLVVNRNAGKLRTSSGGGRSRRSGSTRSGRTDRT
ncbi:unnamed protein product [Pedinophyceae sp. YPF-701]|nr:unnamed protein product [Pedinophyceae sp. YPF-701]